MSVAIQNWIVDELKSQNAFADVGIALGLPDLKSQVILGDAMALVIELRANPDSNHRDIGDPIQREMQVYAVLIGVKSYNDPTGSQTAQHLEQKRLGVRQALFGKRPYPHYEALILAGAELLHFSDEAIFWVERFQTAHVITTESLL